MTDLAPNRQAVLMDAMADRLGAGPFDAQTTDRLRKTCRQCVEHDACILWLMEQGARADAPPGYCLNGEELTASAAQNRS